MQKEQFIKIVNAIVEARIKKIVPALVEKRIAEIKKELIREMTEGTIAVPDEIEIPDMSSMLTEDSILPKRKPVLAPKPVPVPITRTFTKDSKLNAILQQTAEEIRSGKTKSATYADVDAMQEYKQLLTEQYKQAAASGEDMETFQFNMNDIPAIATKRAMMPPTSNAVQSEIEKKIALEVEKKQIERQTGNAELGGLIMRDYRKIMKAVDEKAKAKRGG